MYFLSMFVEPIFLKYGTQVHNRFKIQVFTALYPGVTFYRENFTVPITILIIIISSPLSVAYAK